MRDRILSLILSVEHWIQRKSGRWALLPLRALAYLLLILSMIISNLIAVMGLPILLVNALIRKFSKSKSAPHEEIVVGADTSFESQIRTSETVLVDFWAPWCGPCLMMKPAIESVAEQKAGQLTVVTLNISTNPKAAEKHKVRGIPTLIVFKNGEEIKRNVGALSEQLLGEFVDDCV